MAKKSTKQKQIIPLELRTPVVAVMGHVDHGKTSLLDAIRNTSVQAGEVGGITQNTRAHKVTMTSGQPRTITFIDTPGHEAFSEMRARGARVADIAMLVVAADDGVQPQTKESIKFIKKSGLPLVIACNKMDMPGANSNKVKQELSQNDILVEEYGGDAVFVEVSAVEKTGISDLLEAIQLLAEIHELKAVVPAQGVAEGFVLESNLDTDLGPVALTVLKSGKISRGQYILADDQIHKIRATLDESQKQTDGAAAGDPVWLIGLESVLNVGQNLLFFATEKEALSLQKEIESETQEELEPITEALDDTAMFAELLSQRQSQQNTLTKLKVILRADTKGTLEAIVAKLNDLSFADAKIEVFSAMPGNISESDVEMARDVKAIVLGFQVKIAPQAEILAKNEKVLVRNYQIIYDLINEAEAVVQSMLQPEEEIVEVAKSKVKQVFQLSNGKYVAGCEVTMGNVIKGYRAYVERKGEEIGEGKIVSLKYLKEDVKEAKKGTECGIMLDNQIEIMTGDIIVCFKVER